VSFELRLNAIGYLPKHLLRIRNVSVKRYAGTFWLDITHYNMFFKSLIVTVCFNYRRYPIQSCTGSTGLAAFGLHFQRKSLFFTSHLTPK
jgi:hypothetical protein